VIENARVLEVIALPPIKSLSVQSGDVKAGVRKRQVGSDGLIRSEVTDGDGNRATVTPVVQGAAAA
jgi:hypothetical protein